MRFLIISLILFIVSFSAFAQKDNAVETLSENTQESSTQTNTDLTTEKITLISPNRKVFILTNKSTQLGKGDFISLVHEDNLVCRALVAKTNDQQEAGIKILKIYSLKNWNKMKESLDVQIIRGDDSYFMKSKEKVADKKEEEKKEEKKLINDEEDLYNQSVVLNDGDFEENTNRIIKPDNVFGLAVGQLSGYDAEGGNATYTHFMGHWAYQVHDNFWVEGVYGQSSISDFPDQGKDTKVSNYIARLKYTVAAPFYSYILPYIGYQYQNVDSPDAGKSNNLTTTQAQLNEEITLTDKMKKSGPAIGITILKRLVPGWFIKADLGTDILNAGFCLEF